MNYKLRKASFSGFTGFGFTGKAVLNEPCQRELKSAPTRLGQYIMEMVESIVKGVLSIIQVHLPSADMSMIHRKPRGKTEAELAADLLLQRKRLRE